MAPLLTPDVTRIVGPKLKMLPLMQHSHQVLPIARFHPITNQTRLYAPKYSHNNCAPSRFTTCSLIPSALSPSTSRHHTITAPSTCHASTGDQLDTGSGSSGDNNDDIGDNNGGNNGNSGKKNTDDSNDDDEFLDISQAEQLAASKGITLPEDYAATARDGGLRRSVLQQYTAIATGSFFTSFLARSVPAFRDRLIADRLYFFKILAEICIDSACATVAEVRKRGEEFWDEFEFYLSDLLVGLVLDVVLVTLLAPVAVPGRKKTISQTSGLRQWAAELPSAVFEKSSVTKYSVTDRVGCYVARGLEYSLAGIACGVVGQGIASGMMQLKRHYYGSQENDVAVPPVLETGLVWGAFMALSANTRYQIVFGLERIVDETIARKVPQIAYLTTTLIRFANNIVGGEQFVDMARWAGVQ